MAILITEGLKRLNTGRYGSWKFHGKGPNEKLHRYLARSVAWPAQEYDRELSELRSIVFFPEQPEHT
jgi:hypothetical protein